MANFLPWKHRAEHLPLIPNGGACSLVEIRMPHAGENSGCFLGNSCGLDIYDLGGCWTWPQNYKNNMNKSSTELILPRVSGISRFGEILKVMILGELFGEIDDVISYTSGTSFGVLGPKFSATMRMLWWCRRSSPDGSLLHGLWQQVQDLQGL